MAVPKFRQYFNQMFEENKELFMEFKFIHDDYIKDRQKHVEQFNKVGKKVVAIISDWENKLCGHMEKGNNAVFSAKLADKFNNEVKKYFPMIDWVGVKIKKA